MEVQVIENAIVILVYPKSRPAKAGPVTAATSHVILFMDTALTNDSCGTNCAKKALIAGELKALIAPVQNTRPKISH